MPTRKLVMRWSAIVLRALVALAAIVLLVRGEWATAGSTILIVALMTVPSFLKDHYRVDIPLALDFGTVAFIFLTLFLGQVANLYDYVPFWDKFVHFQSGLLLGATGFRLVYALRSQRRKAVVLEPLFVAVFAVAFSLAIGALWEIAEFFWDMARAVHTQASLADTMWDMIADGVGALIMSGAGYLWMRRYEEIPFGPERKSGS